PYTTLFRSNKRRTFFRLTLFGPNLSVRRRLVKRASDVKSGSIQDVSINHCRRHVLMPEQFLDGADVVSIFQQMCSKAVPERMTACRFADACGAYSEFHGVLQIFFRDMMAAHFARSRVNRNFCSGKNVLPDEFASGVGIFPFQRERQVDSPATASHILPM